MSVLLFCTWLILLLAGIGHGAFWIACFNRINATGFQRRNIKRIEKTFILACFAIPIFIGLGDVELKHWLMAMDVVPDWSRWAWGTKVYGLFCLVCFAWLSPDWITSRFGHWSHAVQQRVDHRQQWKLVDELENPICISGRYRWAMRVPHNQIDQLELNSKTIPIPSSASHWNGLTIGHLSDLHLTGGMSDAYYRFAFEQLMLSSPDAIVLSGDIIDYPNQLEQIPRLLSHLAAPLGCYFVLGNHDRRLGDPEAIRQVMAELKWNDLGSKDHISRTSRGEILWLGNERPWFGSAPKQWPVNSVDESKSAPLRIAVAHSPDQFRWAVRMRADLLLAGHTHGGQVRLPLIGPIVAPSWQGTRYASGIFRQGETVMHVSRGLSGVHPLRWNCRPEVTLLNLQAK